MTKTFYAEVDTGEFIDLHRFSEKSSRDKFVSDRPSSAWKITSKLARENHKEQFQYWKDNK